MFSKIEMITFIYLFHFILT